jgi:hypothetical protein
VTSNIPIIPGSSSLNRVLTRIHWSYSYIFGITGVSLHDFCSLLVDILFFYVYTVILGGNGWSCVNWRFEISQQLRTESTLAHYLYCLGLHWHCLYTWKLVTRDGMNCNWLGKNLKHSCMVAAAELQQKSTGIPTKSPPYCCRIRKETIARQLQQSNQVTIIWKMATAAIARTTPSRQRWWKTAKSGSRCGRSGSIRFAVTINSIKHAKDGCYSFHIVSSVPIFQCCPSDKWNPDLLAGPFPPQGCVLNTVWWIYLSDDNQDTSDVHSRE